MNTGKIYLDIDGNDCTINQMVEREPYWAASRIQQAERYEEMLKDWYRQSRHVGRKGNAPGHGHEIPGVWDSDNGIIAGQACSECALWQMAERLILAEKP